MLLRYISNFSFFIIFILFTSMGFGHNFLNDGRTTFFVSESNTLMNTVVVDEDYADLAVIEGENGVLRRFHKLTFTWDGPNLSEEDTTFSDYRLDVTFTSPSGKTYVVPGYFAADGNAAETSAIAGFKWRCHFNALEIGQYTYQASFRTGTNVAVDFDMTVGLPVAPIDGDSGSFMVEETNKSGIDLRSKGKLEYVGEHYMQWTTGEYYLKIGSNSPENLFEYSGFDDSNSSRTFPAHISDWNTGDPVWKNEQGKGIIGAMNYLSSKGINSHYYVLHRKGEQASPWRKPSESHATYDVSKMAQWQIVFDHMMEKGLMAHIVLSESTNQSYFEVFEPSGDPNFSDKRKIYFREIIARFGYLNAVTWNIGEENGWDRRPPRLSWTGEDARALTTQQQLAFTKYVDDLAYYNDFITVHNGHASTTAIYDRLQGNNSITGTSLQGVLNNDERATISVKQYRNESALSGKKWVIYYDEAFSFDPFPEDAARFRKNILWSTILSGGAGMEHFTTRITNELGEQIFLDVTLENLRYSEEPFQQMKHAYDFYIDNDIPFYNMYNQDDIVDEGICHGDDFQNYVIYREKWGATQKPNTTIDIVGEYEVKWYNPRTGGALLDGAVTTVSTGQDVDLGEPPSEVIEDWVIYLKSTEIGPVPVTSVELGSEDYHLGVGAQTLLSQQVLPENATNKKVQWSTSDPAIVTVDETGIITGIAEGTAVVTVTTEDGGFSDEATIIVIDNVADCVAGGSILVEKYDNIETGKLEFLLNAPNYPDNPSSTFEISEFEIPKRGLEDFYGLRVSGFICVPETGLYTFWISGDDQVQLSISPDNQFKNAQRIAWHDSFTDVQEWDKFTTQRSEEILLFSGQSYYIEALMKEGEFGDHMAVGWRKPSDGPGNEPAELVPGSVLATREQGRTPVTDIELNVPSADLRLDEMLELSETVFPANASNKEVIWTTSDASVATVDQNGNVTGIKIGTAIVSATTVDGNFVAEAVITIIDESIISVTGITLTPETTNLVIGGTLVLEATVAPVDATNREIIWSSSDPSIVSVDSNGEVLGVAFGTAVISASTVDGGFMAESIVTVVGNSQINVTGVQLNVGSAELEVGQTLTLEATVAPMNATNTAVIWSSEDPSVVTVDSDGVITGIATGSAMITATTQDGNFTAQVTITVVEAVAIGVTGISIVPNDIELELEATDILDVSFEPIDATNKEVVWSSEDESILTVSATGEILGVSLGTTTVSATSVDGNFTAQATITVVEAVVIGVTGISIVPNDIELEIEATNILNVSFEPIDATNKEVVWSSEDESIVTVSVTGEILGVSLGTTTVSATSVDGDFVAVATITVIEDSGGNNGSVAVTGISIDIDDLVLRERDIVQINATVLPENASNSFILWVPEDLSIVTVDSNGNVTAKRIGETVITATTLDGGFSKTITVTVLPNNIILYPNPTNDFINITGIDERIDVFIHNSSGVLVKSAKGGTPIYIGGLSNASYLIILSTGDRMRFVKK